MNPSSSAAKTALTRGAVKPWHVIFLAFVAMAVGDVGSFYLVKGEATSFQPIARELLRHVLDSAVILAFVVVVPELRRCLPALFARPASLRSPVELALPLALLLCWGYGIYHIAVCLPLILSSPDSFERLHFSQALPPFDPRFVLLLLGTVLIAPVAEELLIRGYLMNLWIARWGVWPGVLLSSLVFAFFHWDRMIFAWAFGLVLGLVYLRYDSLWPCIALHGAYNLLAFPWLLGQFFYVKQKAAITEISTWSAEIILSLVFIPLAIAFWRRFAPREV